MEFLINFLFESGVSIALLTTVYLFFLRRETFFKQNRIFLITTILFSLLLPFFKLPVPSQQMPVMLPEVTVAPYTDIVGSFMVYGGILSDSFSRVVSATSILGYVYLTGALLFFAIFLTRVVQILMLIRKGGVEEKDGYKQVVLEGSFSPFSFLNYVFVSKGDENDANTKKMLLHELEHIRQGHTVDVIILEILTVFQWFNPFLWLLKRMVRENHEFLADRAVLSKGVNRGVYKQLLLHQHVGRQYVISNSFNYSLIKNRMKMMSKMQSSKLAGLKYIFGVATIFTLLITFGCEDKIKLDLESVRKEKLQAEEILQELKSTNDSTEKEEPVFFVVDEMPEFPGGEKELHRYIATSVNYPEIARKKGIQGRVYVSFIVSKTGEVKNVKLARGVDKVLDEEAMRVVKEMPDWKPGKQRGENVNVSFTVPINFVLQESKPFPRVKAGSVKEKPVFSHVQKMPDFPGGEEAFHKYIKESLKYPETARKNGIQGRVYVSFVVDENGDITDVKLARGVDPALDEEAIRVIKEMPQWTPGMQRNQKVKVGFTVPVNFQIKN
ncbi:MAG: M56 family metallopeptidase [Chlorobi bacterium]|nr:M56 family metallopeptidase [Chlorobiota bacterium]